ncbi:MAG: OmpH family outer membrane protein [Bacteroidales bacterium]|nr:OmpH family outer membrane protein [Bacteroidales bacterium]
MKKVNLIINIVLGIAVAVLFVLYFTSVDEKLQQETGEEEATETSTRTEIEGNLRIAYVNIDSLLSEYEMYQDKRDEFTEEQSSSQEKLQSRSKQLQQQFEDLKEKLNKGLITRAKARMMQQELSKKEQELYQMRDQITSKLSEKEQVIYRQVLQSVMDYLDDYAKEHDYHFILSYSFGGPILYKHKRFNITQRVLEGLNEQYNKNQ